MTKYIAMLRGINVSGQKKIRMVDLAKLLEQHGLINVRTYIQSGNIIFEHESNGRNELASIISKAVHDQYEFDVPVLVISPGKLKKIIDICPWLNDETKADEKLYYTFLFESPAADNLAKLEGINYKNEEYKLIKDVIHFYAGNGYGRAKMNNNFFESKLKVKATTRNLKTIKKLLELSGE